MKQRSGPTIPAQPVAWTIWPHYIGIRASCTMRWRFSVALRRSKKRIITGKRLGNVRPAQIGVSAGMVDRLTSLQRSRLMARVRRTDTAPELIVRQMLWKAGYRYRLHSKCLPGKPDIVFPGRRCVIFVHGCFWHRHEDCKRTTMPNTRRDFWLAKFTANTIRDAKIVAALESAGWRVFVVWECEVNSPGLMEKLVAFLSN